MSDGQGRTERRMITMMCYIYAYNSVSQDETDRSERCVETGRDFQMREIEVGREFHGIRPLVALLIDGRVESETVIRNGLVVGPQNPLKSITHGKRIKVR